MKIRLLAVVALAVWTFVARAETVSSLSLNGQWDFRFEEGKSIEQVGKADFVPTGKMSVPGCYDAQGELRFKRGTGLYRRSFTLARPVENAWLVVNGMGLRGAFEIDGKPLGVHPYPYARLELAMGPLAAGEHTLFAALDNRLDWRTMKLARTFYDFYFFGGFYRDVELKFDNTKLLVRTHEPSIAKPIVLSTVSNQVNFIIFVLSS